MLYWDDVSDSFDGWMNLLHQLGGDSFINFEQDIWETARTYETVPHFGNLRQHHLLERLQDTIRNRWPFLRTGFLINALDTHFYVNDEAVTAVTWKAAVRRVLQAADGRDMGLTEIYGEMEPYAAARAENRNWQAKVRQVLQDERFFLRVGKGIYALKTE